MLLRFCQSQIGITGADHNDDVADEVADVDSAVTHVDDGSVATIGDRPGRPADGGCAVAAPGAELPVVVGGMEQLEPVFQVRGRRQAWRVHRPGSLASPALWMVWGPVSTWASRAAGPA